MLEAINTVTVHFIEQLDNWVENGDIPKNVAEKFKEVLELYVTTIKLLDSQLTDCKSFANATVEHLEKLVETLPNVEKAEVPEELIEIIDEYVEALTSKDDDE